MPNDPQTFQRGAQAAVLGLIVQLVLTIAVALLGLWAKSPAIHAATWYLIGGLPVWGILFLVFNQQRIERIESLEAEQLAARDAAAAALFDERADDLDLARRRLEKLNKWGMAIVSIGLSVYLMAVGVTYFIINYKQIDTRILSESLLVTQSLAPTVKPLLLMFVAAAVALVAFVVARYVAGMTRQPVWTPLRGGAAYLMGTSLMGILITIAAVFVAGMGSKIMFGLLGLVIPAIMALIGLEIALSFLLNVYRPRRPGEITRPAFDSRVLGILTSPDSLGRVISETINYQFGFEISRSWFYQLLGRAITPLVAIGIVVLIAMSSIVIVEPHQQAVIMNGGKVSRVVGAGPHLKLPWPLGSVEKFPVGRIEQVQAGSMRSRVDANVAILWTNEHTEGKEEFLLTPTRSGTTAIEQQVEDDMQAAARLTATPDAATPEAVMVAAEVMVQYKISDLMQYATCAQNVPDFLRAISDDAVTLYFATQPMDTLITTGRAKAGQDLKKMIQAKANAHQLGIEIVFVGIVGIHPPKDGEVAAAYHEQIGALQEKEGAIQDAYKKASQILADVVGSPEEARAIDAALEKRRQLKIDLDQNRITDATQREDAQKALQEQEARIEAMLARARGQAAQVIYEARAYRLSRAITEQAKASRFEAQFLAYEKAPDYYMMRVYLDTLAEGIKPSRKIVVPGDQAPPSILRIDLKESQNALNSIFQNR